MCEFRPPIFVWLMKTKFDFDLLKRAARRLAKETGFTLAEIESMPFYDMVWWLTDEPPPT